MVTEDDRIRWMRKSLLGNLNLPPMADEESTMRRKPFPQRLEEGELIVHTTGLADPYPQYLMLDRDTGRVIGWAHVLPGKAEDQMVRLTSATGSISKMTLFAFSDLLVRLRATG